MPRKRKHRMRGGNQLQNIETANRNLRFINYVQMPKPASQINNNIQPRNYYGYGKRWRGGAKYALIDKYGTLIPAP